MIYKKFKDKKLSGLAFGCMRLPVIDGNDSNIDEATSQKMIDYAMEKGINYYDTAWGYHGGNSELVVGKCLSKYPRDSFYLASKFPGYDTSNFGKTEEIFEKQLEKCQVSYFDFYLIHNVCELNIEQYMDEENFGTVSYLKEQVKNGRIKHLGFSCHGDLNVLKRFTEKYGDDMEFCQLQLNYLDYTFQDDVNKIKYLDGKSIPIWVMEPIRGGRLAKLSDEHEARLKALRPNASIVSWAFRFLQSLPSVTIVLSGMSDEAQTKENIEIWNTDEPLNDKEMDTLLKIADEMLSVKTLPCTACHYCTSHCPKELDIPGTITQYNEHMFTGGGFLAPMYFMAVPKEKQPSACIGCRACEKVCPQQIKISEMMSEMAKQLEQSSF